MTPACARSAAAPPLTNAAMPRAETTLMPKLLEHEAAFRLAKLVADEL